MCVCRQLLPLFAVPLAFTQFFPLRSILQGFYALNAITCCGHVRAHMKHINISMYIQLPYIRLHVLAKKVYVIHTLYKTKLARYNGSLKTFTVQAPWKF